MKKKILYTCDVCHADYADEERANACENSHAKNLVIVDCRYNSLSACNRFPAYIVVKADDGKKRVYRRV